MPRCRATFVHPRTKAVDARLIAFTTLARLSDDARDAEGCGRLERRSRQILWVDHVFDPEDFGHRPGACLDTRLAVFEITYDWDQHLVNVPAMQIDPVVRLARRLGHHRMRYAFRGRAQRFARKLA